MASAATRKALAFQPLSVPAAMSSTHRPKPRIASAARVRMSSLAGFCSASQALSTCSMDQPASPNSVRPTIRELPLSVWKARRSVVSSFRSDGSALRVSSAASPFCTTSRASSRKMSCRSSSSKSSSAVAGAGAGMACMVTVLARSLSAAVAAVGSCAVTAADASRALLAMAEWPASAAWPASVSRRAVSSAAPVTVSASLTTAATSCDSMSSPRETPASASPRLCAARPISGLSSPVLSS